MYFRRNHIWCSQPLNFWNFYGFCYSQLRQSGQIQGQLRQYVNMNLNTCRCWFLIPDIGSSNRTRKSMTGRPKCIMCGNKGDTQETRGVTSFQKLILFLDTIIRTTHKWDIWYFNGYFFVYEPRHLINN